ncbi:MAG: hypothetical protein J6T15_05140 [Bacilli bacterium]|nr:hypothetical protein [Bacilli bacterium]
MNTNFSYDRMDYYSILDYLKDQASYFSNGTWTDFSDGDLGTVLLKLIAMNADTTNFQVEKGISELYLDTVKERVNAIALCKLIGYEPRHYQSAVVSVMYAIADVVYDNRIPAYTAFTNSNGTVFFYNIEDIPVSVGTGSFNAYQGYPQEKSISVGEIDSRGRYYLPDYTVGTNTIQIKQAGSIMTHVENALYGEGELCYSVHIDLDNRLYIQFPTYYETILSPNVPIEIRYLLSDGIEGRIGAGILDGIVRLDNGTQVAYTNTYGSEGGYNPETVEEIRRNAPSFAKTMETLVTLNDFRILAKEYDGISDVVALDYNYPESGLIQPTDDYVNDAYKVNLYVLLEDSDTIIQDDDEIDESLGEYINADNFNFETTQNLVLNSVTNVYNTVGVDASLSGSVRFDTLSNIEEIIIKYSIVGDNTDILRIDYSDTFSDSYTGGTNGTVRITRDQMLSGDILSMYFQNNSGNGVAYFSIFLVELAGEPTTTQYKQLVQKYMDKVAKRKPAGIQVNYFDVEYIRPTLIMNIYMDEEDLRYSTTSGSVKAYLEQLYSRKNRKIGEAVYTSHIFKEILDHFDYIDYLEIISLEYSVAGAIKPNYTQFVELLGTNMTVNVLPYEEE